MPCKRIFLLALGFVFLGVSALYAGEPAFKVGEKIHYRVKQMGVKAGDATLEFKGETYLEGKKYALILFTADGFNFFDEERIYIDPDTFLPQKIMRDLNIFGKKEKIMEEYFQQDGFIRVTKTADGKTTVQTIEKKGAVDNIYGFIYRYRLLGDPQSTVSLDVSLPTVDVKIARVKEVEFNAGGKMYRAVLMRSVPEKYSIWFDVGEKRLPLRIAGAIGLSNTVMTMVSVEEK